MKQIKPQFKFYATLLDKFQGYLSSSEIYQEYWGFSENPSKTEEEFEFEQFQGLIDSINRVPFESEAADKGTAFNELVDCLIEHRKSDKMEMKSIGEPGAIPVSIEVKFKNHVFYFPYALTMEFAKYFKGAITQQFVEAIIETKYGPVLLYGYLDELLPFKIADIKTTSKYSAFKFKNNWQHIVYPYCLNECGTPINDFEYTVTDFKNTWTENYTFRPEIDTLKLVQHCERFIEFLQQNRKLITDTKIFALDNIKY